MKILFLTNNEITKPLIYWLTIQKNEVIEWNERISSFDIATLMPDFIVSYNYRFIIKNDVISLFPKKIINLHISYLPWNRGSDPNIWSFIDNTPKGVTIHYIDERIDTGNIICQKLMKFDEYTETFESTYKKLHLEIQILCKENWCKICTAKIISHEQPSGGSVHLLKDLLPIKERFGSSLYSMKIAFFKKKIDNTG